MDISIRNHIKSNFKNSSCDEIKIAIEENAKSKEELALPGLGVFMEIIWNNSNKDMQNEMINILKNNL